MKKPRLLEFWNDSVPVKRHSQSSKRIKSEALKEWVEDDYDRDYEDVNEHLTNQDWKEPYWVGHLFNEYIGWQKSNPCHGAWILRDDSYITVETGCHRRIVEGYMNLSEKELETWWVKIQMDGAYTHSKMTDAQKKTLNKFFKQYEDLYESNVLWERERNSR